MKNVCNRYAPTPFYFLNDEFDKTEIIKQLDFMLENGIKSFFLHVRDGVTNQAWGTDKFFGNVKFLIERAIERGITPWLYDEDSYPSGQVGGKLVIDKPELLSYGIQVDKIIADENSVAKKYLGKVKGLYAYVVKSVDGKEEVAVLENCFGPVRRNWYKRDMTKTYYPDMTDTVFNHIRGCTCYTEILFEADVPAGEVVYVAYLKPTKTDMRYGTLVSCLNRATTDEIIKRVYEKYKEYVGEYFGKEIPGIFIDEPSLGGGLPYTEQLPAFFVDTVGYSFKENLYKLSAEYEGDGAQFRRDYVRSVKALFTENFVRPISSWCKENNLKLVGHFSGEEDPLTQALSGQDIYENVGLLDVPGFDVITTNIGDYKHPSLILGANLVASSAHQNDRKTVLAECFALSPYNFGYDGLKRTADWLFVCGINWIVPHGFHYGYCAFQRADAGKSFFFQDDLFDDYVKFSRYAERVCALLHRYERRNDCLVVIPDGTFAEEIPFPIGNSGIAPSKRALSILEKLYNVVRFFISHHIGFDLTQTSSLGKANVANGKMIVGNKEYSKVIIPKGGVEEQNLYLNIKDKCNAVLVSEETSNIVDCEDCIRGDKKDFLVYKKVNESGFLLFVFNNSLNEDSLEISLDEKTALYDAEEDRYYALDIINGKCKLHFKPYQSMILICGNSLEKADLKAYKETDYIPDYSFITNQETVYKPKYTKSVIYHHRLKIKDFGGNKKCADVKDSRIRDVWGTCDEIYRSEYLIPYFDTAPRLKPTYPVFAAFYSEVPCKDCEDVVLFDRDTLIGEYKIFWNNKLVDKKDIFQTRVYDKHNFYFKPKWRKGINKLKIVFEKAEEFDGVVGEIFIVDKKAIAEHQDLKALNRSI